eukprot:TRINITY_DN31148_c0_g1_i3.p1 TRINITY_DN31148_c0_g1~~TRINITY_DN31148_c0_g1_i3.p1  ORF type:complete len:116 (-),score=28.92 TRINITY_DN31148_c0_g1_i3:225-572(-)
MCIRDSGRSSGRYYQPQQPSTTSQPQYQQYDQGASSGNYNDEYDDGASSGRSSARSYSSSRTSSSQRSGVDARAKPPVNGKKRLEDALAAVAAAGPPILKSSARVPRPPQNNKGR